MRWRRTERWDSFSFLCVLCGDEKKKEGFEKETKKLELLSRDAKAEEQQRNKKEKNIVWLYLWVQDSRIIIITNIIFFLLFFTLSVETNSYAIFTKTFILYNSEKERQIGKSSR